MLVREVTTSPPITASARKSRRVGLRMLEEHAIPAMRVLDDHGHSIGVVSEADLVRDAVLPDSRIRMISVRVTDTATAGSVDSALAIRVVDGTRSGKALTR